MADRYPLSGKNYFCTVLFLLAHVSIFYEINNLPLYHDVSHLVSIVIINIRLTSSDSDYQTRINKKFHNADYTSVQTTRKIEKFTPTGLRMTQDEKNRTTRRKGDTTEMNLH